MNNNKIKKLIKLREDWFNLFGYEKDINQRIEFELNKIEEFKE